jgi:uncharacterized protein YfeS
MTLAKEHPDEFLIDTGLKDRNGNDIVNLPPTVYILDSIALLVPENISKEEELSGQMSTTAAAKANAKIFREIIPKLKQANIILIGINHLTTKIEINPMIHTKAAINYLKTDESTVGGSTPLYLANNIFKFEAGDKLKDSELFGINGFTVKISLIKSRSNRAGQEGYYVYDQVRGYNNYLTNLLYCKNNKILQGAGVGYYFDGEEGGVTKFRLSTFMDKIKQNKSFRLFFKKMIRKLYRTTYINKIETEEEYDEEEDIEAADPPAVQTTTAPHKRTKSK